MLYASVLRCNAATKNGSASSNFPAWQCNNPCAVATTAFWYTSLLTPSGTPMTPSPSTGINSSVEAAQKLAVGVSATIVDTDDPDDDGYDTNDATSTSVSDAEYMMCRELSRKNEGPFERMRLCV